MTPLAFVSIAFNSLASSSLQKEKRKEMKMGDTF